MSFALETNGSSRFNCTNENDASFTSYNRGALTEPITLTSGGEPVMLAPGKTWFMIFPGDASTARTAAWGGPGSVFYE